MSDTMSYKSRKSAADYDLNEQEWNAMFKDTDAAKPMMPVNVSENGRRIWGEAIRYFFLFFLPIVTLVAFTFAKSSIVYLALQIQKGTAAVTSDDPDGDSDGDSVNREAIMGQAYVLMTILAMFAPCCNVVFNLCLSSAREFVWPEWRVALKASILGFIEGLGLGAFLLGALPRLSALNMISAFLLLLPVAYLKDIQQRSWGRKLLVMVCFLVALGGLFAFWILPSKNLSVPDTDAIYMFAFVGGSIFLVGFSWFFKRTDCLKLQNLKVYYFKGFLRGWFSTAGVIVSAWLIYWLIHDNEVADFFTSEYTFQNIGYENGAIIAASVSVGSSILAWIYSWCSISLCMQKVGVFLPVVLAPLTVFGTVFSYCHFFTSGEDECVAIDSSFMWEGVTYAALYITGILLSLPMFKEPKVPMPMGKSLWYVPGFDSVFTSENIVLNRRERDLKIKQHRHVESQESLPSLVSNSDAGDAQTNGVVARAAMQAINQVKKNAENHVYICTTMWHENKKEMHYLLASYSRIDKGRTDTDEKTNYEAHVMFDDAITKSGGYNEYVDTFISLLPSNIRSMSETVTPYGFQIQIVMPHGMEIFVHLKDKSKIRNKKRWSQIMYMFFLLRYRVITQGLDLNNVFILVTDGDTEFDMPSTRDLLQYLKRNLITGGVCGRVFPKGTGPIAWLQMFEYSVGHWLQKSAEHVLGSVLCLPGCFSMLRGTAVEECMHIYTRESKTGKDFLQYDQGEDRWLSTLMLKQGWLLQYAPSADSYTYCPMDFHEFYNQRRRWVSSTIANIVDLLFNASSVVMTNISVSKFYMFYQAVLLLGTIIAPAIVVMMYAAGLYSGFGINQTALIIVLMLLMYAYAWVCMKCKNDTQINVALVASIILGVGMIFVMTGFVAGVAGDIVSVAGIFLITLIMSVIVAGLLHPRECGALMCGFVYLFMIPSCFVMLMIYSIAAINNVSWGTRDGTKKAEKKDGKKDNATYARKLMAKMMFWKKAPEEATALLSADAEKLENDGSAGSAGSADISDALKTDDDEPTEEQIKADPFKYMLGRRDELDLIVRSQSTPIAAAGNKNISERGFRYIKGLVDINSQADIKSITGESVDFEDKESEDLFWELLMEKYLFIEKETALTRAKKAELYTALGELRDQSIYGFLFANTCLIMFYLAIYVQDTLIVSGINLGTLALSLFAVLVAVQFFAMIFHRLSMVLHVASSSILFNRHRNAKKTQLKKLRKQNNGPGVVDMEIVQGDSNQQATILFNGEALSDDAVVIVNGVQLNLAKLDDVSTDEAVYNTPSAKLSEEIEVEDENDDEDEIVENMSQAQIDDEIVNASA